MPAAVGLSFPSAACGYDSWPRQGSAMCMLVFGKNIETPTMPGQIPRVFMNRRFKGGFRSPQKTHASECWSFRSQHCHRRVALGKWLIHEGFFPSEVGNEHKRWEATSAPQFLSLHPRAVCVYRHTCNVLATSCSLGTMDVGLQVTGVGVDCDKGPAWLCSWCAGKWLLIEQLSC